MGVAAFKPAQFNASPQILSLSAIWLLLMQIAAYQAMLTANS
jgi:hypothetical protein